MKSIKELNNHLNENQMNLITSWYNNFPSYQTIEDNLIEDEICYCEDKTFFINKFNLFFHEAFKCKDMYLYYVGEKKDRFNIKFVQLMGFDFKWQEEELIKNKGDSFKTLFNLFNDEDILRFIKTKILYLVKEYIDNKNITDINYDFSIKKDPELFIAASFIFIDILAFCDEDRHRAYSDGQQDKIVYEVIKDNRQMINEFLKNNKKRN